VPRNARADQARRKSVRSGDETDTERQLPLPEPGYYEPLSDRGGDRAAAMYSLIVTAKLNDVDPRAWLADVLRRIADQPIKRLEELLPWNWREAPTEGAVAA
jgi:IS66 C-terminal element